MGCACAHWPRRRHMTRRVSVAACETRLTRDHQRSARRVGKVFGPVYPVVEPIDEQREDDANDQSDTKARRQVELRIRVPRRGWDLRAFNGGKVAVESRLLFGRGFAVCEKRRVLSLQDR